MTTEESTETSQESAETKEVEGLQDAHMSFLGHLGELRQRLVYSIVAVFIAFGVCWFFVEELFIFLQQPLVEAARATGHEASSNLHYADVTEEFFTMLKTAALAAIFAASPAVFYNIWKFVAPGLYPNEKRAVLPFMLFGTLCFFAGAAFCYYVVIPLGYGFLFDFSDVSQPMLMINEYFGTTTKLLLAFGVVFQLPVVTYFLSAVGILTHRILIKQWRIAVVVAFILAAMLTPPDVITQALLAGPMILLYVISVVIAYVQTRRRERAEE